MIWTGGIAAYNCCIVDGKGSKEGENGRRTRIYSVKRLARAFVWRAKEPREGKLTMIAQIRESREIEGGHDVYAAVSPPKC